MIPIGVAIKTARLKMGMSQASLSEKAGISINSISSIERGTKFPNIRTVETLGDCIGIEGWRIHRYAARIKSETATQVTTDADSICTSSDAVTHSTRA